MLLYRVSISDNTVDTVIGSVGGVVIGIVIIGVVVLWSRNEIERSYAAAMKLKNVSSIYFCVLEHTDTYHVLARHTDHIILYKVDRGKLVQVYDYELNKILVRQASVINASGHVSPGAEIINHEGDPMKFTLFALSKKVINKPLKGVDLMQALSRLTE